MQHGDPLDARRGTRLRPGRYRLVLVATAGSHRGRRAEGMLELRLASPTDRSPEHPAERAPADTSVTPLWGATSIDFTAVGAPVEPRGSDWAPAPTSRDPLHPGVMALVERSDARGHPPATELLIGTLWNRRVDDGRIGLDGPGIDLGIDRQRGDSAWGKWGPWGLMVDGSGYFCLLPLARDSV